MKHLNLDVYEPGDLVGTVSQDGKVALYRVKTDGVLAPADNHLFVGDPWLDTKIEDLNPELSVRSYNLLKREGVHTLGDMCNIYDMAGREGFLDFRNCREKDADEMVSHIENLRGESTP